MYHPLMREYLIKSISDLLRELKKKEETTFEQVAWSSDISKSHLSNIINGNNNISLCTLDRIAEAHNKKIKISFVDADKK